MPDKADPPLKTYVELYEKWLGLKKKHLRPPLSSVGIKNDAEPLVGSLTLPLEPKTKRAEYVESYRRPAGVSFYESVKCSCEGCKDSADRKWDLHNGMKCSMVLTHSLPPPKRNSRRKNREKESSFIPKALVGSEGAKLLAKDKDRAIPLGSQDWTCEVVLLYTSLSTHRKQYHASLRAAQLLSCKGVDYWAIDANMDAGKSRPDKGLIARWRHLHYIFRDPTKEKGSSKRDIIVPQILVDGVPLGGFSELLLLEEDGDLDYILAGEACPNCLVDRKAQCGKIPKLNDDGSRVDSAEDFNEFCIRSVVPDYCFNCGAVFRNLLADEIVPQPARKPLLVHCYKSNHRSEPCVGLQFSRDWLQKKFENIPTKETDQGPRKGRLFVF